MRTRERPQNYSTVRRGVVGYVRFNRERGRGGVVSARDGHQEKHPTRSQECWQQPPGLKIEGSNPECRSNPDAEKTHSPGTPVDASRDSRTIMGGAVFYAPQPTPNASTTGRIGRKHISMRGSGTQERALVGVHQRSPPEESTGRTTGNQTLLGGGEGGAVD